MHVTFDLNVPALDLSSCLRPSQQYSLSLSAIFLLFCSCFHTHTSLMETMQEPSIIIRLIFLMDSKRVLIRSVQSNEFKRH